MCRVVNRATANTPSHLVSVPPTPSGVLSPLVRCPHNSLRWWCSWIISLKTEVSLNSAVPDPSPFLVSPVALRQKSRNKKKSSRGENTKFLEIKSRRWCDTRSRHGLWAVLLAQEGGGENKEEKNKEEVCQVVFWTGTSGMIMRKDAKGRIRARGGGEEFHWDDFFGPEQ